MSNSLRIEGADQFHADLTRTVRDYPRTVREAAEAVAESLEFRARARGQFLGGVAAKASSSIRQQGNKVVGGRMAPYFFGAEYGSLRYKQFVSFRGNAWRGWQGSPGRMIGETVRTDARALMAAFLKRIDDAHSVAFPD